jgi:hypothetical protein
LQLGTKADSLLEELVRTFQLPEELAELAPPEPEPVAPQGLPPEAAPPLSIVE